MTKNETEYGIGRVPADVNALDELMAQIEAAQIVGRQQCANARRVQADRPGPVYRPSRCSYRGCRQPGTMGASLGPACPDHYDDLS